MEKYKNYVEIPGARKDTKHLLYKDYTYVKDKVNANLKITYVRCSRYKSENCPARGQVNELNRLVVNDKISHTCVQTPELLQLQMAKHRLKEAAKRANGSLNDEHTRIITQEETLVKRKLPYTKAKRFMKTSRDEFLEPDLRTLDKLLAFLEKRDNPLVKKCLKDIVRFEEPGE